jgi:glycosyl hydrolase family 113
MNVHRFPPVALVLGVLALAGALFAQGPTSTAAGVAAPPPSPDAPPARSKPSVQRGIVVSCPGFGREWGSEEMWATLDELQEHGANAVQIHPYAGIRNDGTIRDRSFGDPENPPGWITRPIAEARRRGMKLMMKPHLAYWGSRFSWRGEIDFGEDEDAWNRFFRGYETWIVNLARMSRGADSFVVGTELDRTLHREKDWRRIIAAVRKVYSGPLTYAANWTDYQRVPFWDALDTVGIQAYFPLAATPKAKPPTPELQEPQLKSAWAARIRELEAFSKKAGKAIVFTELGYHCTAKVALEPWDYSKGEKKYEALQARCLKAALEAIEESQAVRGAYLWKWFPGPRKPRDFNLEAEHMRKVLRDFWLPRHRRERELAAKAQKAAASASVSEEKKD